MNHVTITNTAALRTAMHIRARDKWQPAFTWIRLEAPKDGETHGRMIATDGFSLLFSREAHDSLETCYWRPVGTWKVPKTATSVTLREDSAVIETGKKMDVKPIEWAKEGDFGWPDADRVLPAPDAEVVPLSGPVDSIRGGKIAEAYGVNHGAWIPMPGGKLARLWNTKETDLVILVPLRDVEGWIA